MTGRTVSILYGMAADTFPLSVSLMSWLVSCTAVSKSDLQSSEDELTGSLLLLLVLLLLIEVWSEAS